MAPWCENHALASDRQLQRGVRYEFYRIGAPAVAALKCGHTGVRVNPDLDKGKSVFPLVVRVLDGKPYVLCDLSDAKGTLAGKEVRGINGVADEPFQYYDDLVLNALDFSFRKYSPQNRALPADMLERQPNGKYRMVKHPNWGIQQPSKPTFTGKVYILINGSSFSTTSEFLSLVHARKRAKFIGEESGGGYYGNTSGPGAILELPNTKLQAYVPLMTYYMAVRDYKAASHGVVPEYPIKYSIDELLEGKDKELALALDLARRP